MLLLELFFSIRKMPRSAAGQKRQNEVDLENERGLEELRNLKKKAKEASEGGLFTEVSKNVTILNTYIMYRMK